MKVTIIDNGPYKVQGASELDLRDEQGNPVDLRGRDTVMLCRCGASTKKPFCDGTHSKIGFEAAMAAVEGSA